MGRGGRDWGGHAPGMIIVWVQCLGVNVRLAAVACGEVMLVGLAGWLAA